MDKDVLELTKTNQDLCCNLQKSQTENNFLRVRITDAESGCKIISSGSEESIHSDLSSTVLDYEGPELPNKSTDLSKELISLKASYNEMEHAFDQYRRDTIQEIDDEQDLSEKLNELNTKYTEIKDHRDVLQAEVKTLS